MQKNYAIMRINKLTTNNDFAKVINHNNRNYQHSTGVVEDLSKFNLTEGITDYKKLKEILDFRNQLIEFQSSKKVAKNRVRGFELLFAVNSEFMKDDFKRDEFFKNALKWCKEVFGETNFINSVIHLDEVGSPHMHVTMLCLCKQNDITNYAAAKWVSNRQSLTALQDTFHSKVAYLGLQRGQSAKYTHNYHKTKQEYVKLIEKDLRTIQSLQPHERDLLAIKGLKALQDQQNLVKSMKIKQQEISQALTNEFEF